MTDALTNAFDNLRAEARTSAEPHGALLVRPAPGDWFTGVFVGHESREAPFGTVEVAQVVGVSLPESKPDPAQVFRLDLDCSVLRRELGSDAENGPPAVGSLLYVEAQGERTSKAGRRYRAFVVRTSDPTPDSVAMVAGASPGPAAPMANADDDIPFSPSVF